MAYNLTARLQLKDNMSGKLRRAARSASESGGAFRKMGRAAGVASSAIIGLGGAIATATVTTGIIRMGATFDQEMGRVSAVTGAAGDDLESLRDKAKEMGETTMYNSSQSAEALRYLGQAGFDTGQIMGSVEDTLNLAAAGQLELGRAADISSNILSGFNLEAAEMGRVSDVLAKAASSANTNVEQLGGAMSYVAPVASSMGMSMEETAGAIGVLSNAGIQGEKAGTALRGMFSQLQMATGQTADTLEEFGLAAEDVDPSVNSLSEILQTLSDAGVESSDAMALVGQEAGPALARMLDEGTDGLDEMIEKLEDSNGAAKDMSDTVNDNLMGDFRELKSAVQGFGLEIYERAEPALRDLTQQAKDWTGVASAFITFLSGDKIGAYEKLADIFGVIRNGKGDIAEVSDMNFMSMIEQGFGGEAAEKVRNMMSRFEDLSDTIDDIASWLEDAYENVKEFGNWIIDNWPQIKATVAGLTGAFVALRIAMTALTIIETITGLLRAYRTATLAAATAQMTLNLALYASPLGWIAALIATVIAAGILLWQNWDKISAHAEKLWATIQLAWNMIQTKTKMLWASIKAVWNQLKTRTQEIWENVKTSISDAMESASTAVSNFFSPLLGFISDVKGAWQDFTGMLDNFSMPDIGGMASAVGNFITDGGGGQADSNAYHGMARVPRDGFRARLHKDEMVLPRGPAEAVRNGEAIDDVPFQAAQPVKNTQAVDDTSSDARISGGNSSGGGQSASATGDGFSINISEMNVRQESDITSIAKELSRELRTAQAGGA